MLATARVTDLTTGDSDTQDAREDGQYPFFVRSQTVEAIDSYSFDGEAVLTSGDGAGVGKIFHHFIGKLEFHQRVYLFHNFKRITGRYFFYFLREHLHRVALAGNAKSTVDSLRRPMLRMFPVCLPSPPEQQTIVEFLDYETAKIDALIAMQQQLIALLGEKRQAVISHAVTKGLNPDAPMRDSGVEWLGEVPAHWEVYRLKHLATSIKAGPFGSSLTKDVYVKSGYRVYGQEQVIPNDFSIGDYYISDVKFKEMSQYSVSPGDVLISCVGTFGKIAIVPETAEPGIINPRLLRLCCSSAVSPEYLVEVLRSQVTFEQFSILSRGGTMDIINIGTLSSIVVPLPPADEQLLLLDYIGSSSRKFEKLIEAANAMVDLLKERRTAIISAAVTGKIDVRNWKPPADERPQKSNKEAA